MNPDLENIEKCIYDKEVMIDLLYMNTDDFLDKHTKVDDYNRLVNDVINMLESGLIEEEHPHQAEIDALDVTMNEAIAEYQD